MFETIIKAGLLANCRAESWLYEINKKAEAELELQKVVKDRGAVRLIMQDAEMLSEMYGISYIWCMDKAVQLFKSGKKVSEVVNFFDRIAF